jgi:hypothetical protein
MQTIQDELLLRIEDIKNNNVQTLSRKELFIELISKDDSDYSYIQNEKKVNQKYFSLKEARKKLNLSQLKDHHGVMR